MKVKNGIEIKLKESGIPYTTFRLTGFYQGLIEQYAIPILENLPIWVTNENTYISIWIPKILPNSVYVPYKFLKLKIKHMPTTTEDSVIIVKTRELCETILVQPEFQNIRRHIDAFLADEAAKAQYQMVVERGEQLQHKQQMAVPLSNEEVAEFENQREQLVNNPFALLRIIRCQKRADFVGSRQRPDQIQRHSPQKRGLVG